MSAIPRTVVEVAWRALSELRARTYYPRVAYVIHMHPALWRRAINEAGYPGALSFGGTDGPNRMLGCVVERDPTMDEDHIRISMRFDVAS